MWAEFVEDGIGQIDYFGVEFEEAVVISLDEPGGTYCTNQLSQNGQKASIKFF